MTQNTMIKVNQYSQKRLVSVFIFSSIVLIAFLSYKDILNYFFTAMDSFTLIDTGRIRSFKDVVRIFSEPLMNGTEFAEIMKYYRPISTLSFGLDYAVWGLDPFGYHLTNLILHALVSVLIFFLLSFLTKKDRVTAWFGAIIFTIHPILAESVPAIARRQDIMATLFLLLSLLLFFKYAAGVLYKGAYLLFSLFFYALALGSKETAVILPFLICAYLVLFQYNKFSKTVLVDVLKKNALYFEVTLVLLGWRTYILRGLGGYNSGISVPVTPIFQSITNFFRYLLYPVPFLNMPAIPSRNLNGQSYSLFSLLTIAVLLMFFLMVSLPRQRRRMRKFLVGLNEGKVVLFSIVWIGLFLTLHVSAQVFCAYHMYMAAVPFCMVLSVVMTKSFRNKHTIIGSVMFIATAALSISFLAYSPLTRNYGEWKESGDISSMFLSELSGIVAGLPPKSIIHIYDLPAAISSYKLENPHAVSVTYLNSYSIKSWIEMKYPDKFPEVVVERTIELETLPKKLYLETETLEGHNVNIIVNFGRGTKGGERERI